jgi:ABC-type phosphate transport system substrate-binding protein
MKRLIPIVLLVPVCACTPSSSDEGRRLIQNKGSDSLAPVALAWAASYESVNG